MQKPILIMALAAVVLAGCGRDDEASEQMTTPAVSAPESTSTPAGNNPTGTAATDPSVPPSEQSVQPATPSSTAQETTSAPPNELTKEEEKNNMPQPGSVHSHSTPVREQSGQTSGQ